MLHRCISHARQAGVLTRLQVISAWLGMLSKAKISTRMELPRKEISYLTESQQKAVAARGNVLVMAGAGTGKTKTLVARSLDCLDRERASLDELLIVTFTEAA